MLMPLVACLLPAFSSAQHKWYNPANSMFKVVQGQGWQNEPQGIYHRFPDRAKELVRADVWELSKSSAGLAIHFTTDASQILVRYTVSGVAAMPHMPATGVSGLDLYRMDVDGRLQYVKGKFPWNFKDTCIYTFLPAPLNMDKNNGLHEYRLFLPLYNEVTWLEVGVPQEASLNFLPVRSEKPIAVYGTSIAQGACASRPAMSWINMLSRSLNIPALNFGFSGNGRMEKEVLSLIAEVDAQLYVLDCLPNLVEVSDDVFLHKIKEGVTLLRKKHTTPILLVENSAASPSFSDSAAIQRNRLLAKCYTELVAEGIKGLYYLSCDMLAFPADGTVDGVHPNDLGMASIANAYEKKIREILKIQNKESGKSENQ